MAAWCCFPRGISTMASNLRLSSLIPAGLIVESIAEEEGVIVVSARAGPTSGLARYADGYRAASIADTSERPRICPVQARRWSFGSWPDVLSATRHSADGGSSPNGSTMALSPSDPGGRRGWSASFIILGWRSAAGRPPSFAKRLMVPVSNDTLLRVVRRRACSCHRSAECRRHR